MIIGERIKKLRKALHLTQQDFADKLSLKRNTVGGYEIGTVVPSDRTISDICREFNANETWLRTGEGEMLNPISRDDQIADFMADIFKDEEESFKRRFVAALSKLGESEWELLEKIALELVESNKKG